MPDHVAEETFIAIDVETTGLFPARGDRVIEIGAVMIKGMKPADEYQSLINVERRISRAAGQIHGISANMLSDAPCAKDVIAGLRSFISDHPLIAHNAAFDRVFLLREFGFFGFAMMNRWHCTLEQSRRRFPMLRDHRLDSVYRHLFGTEPETAQRHRALDDARMTARVWMELRKR